MTLEVRGLTVSDAGRTLVSGVDLVIEPGKVTAVIGANGAGKSELVLALAGMLPITGGAVLLDGKPLTGLGPEAIRRAGVAAVPEGHRVLTALSVDDNLRAAGCLLGGGSGAELALGIAESAVVVRSGKMRYHSAAGPLAADATLLHSANFGV